MTTAAITNPGSGIHVPIAAEVNEPRDSDSSPARAVATVITGQMGLSGLTAKIGNASAMVVICILLFLAREDSKEDRAISRDEARQERASNSAALERLGNKFDGMSGKLENMTNELRQTRNSHERMELSFKQALTDGSFHPSTPKKD